MASDAATFVPMRSDNALQHLLMANPVAHAPADHLFETKAWLERRDAAGWFRVVLDDSGGIAGFVQIAEIHHKNRFGWLGIALLSAARGKGLALRVLAETERVAKDELGLRKLLLQLRADNLAALRLYGRAGWHRVGCLRAHYDDGVTLHDALVFEKLLEST